MVKVLAVADPAVEVYKNIINDYKAEVKFDIVPWENYFDTMMNAFKGNADYDIVMVAGHLWLREFVEADYLAELNYDFEDILPIIAKEMMYDGKIYLSPSFCDGHMIVYNKDVLSKLVDIKEVIDTNTYIEWAQKLADSGIETPVAMKAHASEIFLDALPYLREHGVDVYGPDGACNFTSEQLGKYLTLKKHAHIDTHTYGNDEIKDAIISGEAVLATTWSGQLGVIASQCKNANSLGYATFDKAWNVTWSFAVCESSENKQQAMDFLAYLRTPKIDKKVGEYCGAPVRKSSYTTGNCPWYDIQLKMIEEYATPLPDVADLSTKNQQLYDTIYNEFKGAV
ncbi:MAG: hypothetical protein BEN19_03415 [Epulopiscium sp. Nuni2H_MBin003]|nr:MAG: hypothetical protein BEN19_03415 [Epulopiscium sp. Nuni2H_MBin003]